MLKIPLLEREELLIQQLLQPHTEEVLVTALDAAALETILDEILLSNIVTPSTNDISFLNDKIPA